MRYEPPRLLHDVVAVSRHFRDQLASIPEAHLVDRVNRCVGQLLSNCAGCVIHRGPGRAHHHWWSQTLQHHCSAVGQHPPACDHGGMFATLIPVDISKVAAAPIAYWQNPCGLRAHLPSSHEMPTATPETT